MGRSKRRLAATCATVAAVVVTTGGVGFAQGPGTDARPAQIAQAQPGGRVADIRIEGMQRIDASTVRSYMRVGPGDPFDAGRIDESLKALFDTNLFADVTIRRDGDSLVVTVAENPIINRIAFEGNRRLTEEQLTSEVQTRARTVFTRSRVQSDVQRVLDLYRRNGRFAAAVEPKVIQLDQNRVDLVFEINEGDRTGVNRISFVGNQVYGDGSLRDVILTRETAWWRFLSTSVSAASCPTATWGGLPAGHSVMCRPPTCCPGVLRLPVSKTRLCWWARPRPVSWSCV
jgi:outer membrane protein insertion porin family